MKTKVLPLCLGILAIASVSWAAMSTPSQNTNTPANGTTGGNATAQPMGHVCGVRFCGDHCHHHRHVWCDGRRHWLCYGHD